MSASPEVSRRNGAKSKGPVTPKGKAISSRNATKHGLLAKQPPLLLSEDLETFEGLVQGLIDYYQPNNPVEHFLVQQAAMAMHKQYRLWNVEAAIANLEILKLQRSTKYPDVVIPPSGLPSVVEQFLENRTPRRELLQGEKMSLQELIQNIETTLTSSVVKKGTAQLKALHFTIGDTYYKKDRGPEVYDYQDDLDDWFVEHWKESKQGYTVDVDEAVARVEQLLLLAKQRLKTVEHNLADIKLIDQGIVRAESAIQGIQNPDLFVRYQRDINNNLYDALDRIEQLQARRQNQDPMGSFSQGEI